MATEVIAMIKNNIRKHIVMPLGLITAICLAIPTVRADNFTVVGPGGGGAMYHATISPHDPNEVLVACDMTGAYISHDGGHSWRMFNLRGTVQFFAFDPVRPRVIYAATKALWCSTDDGESWNLVWPRPSTVSGIRMNSDHADETILSDSNPLGEIVALAIDPADSRILTAAAVKDGAAALYVSNDDGGNWEKATALSEPPQNIWIDPHSPAGDRDLYIAGKQGVTVRHQGK